MQKYTQLTILSVYSSYKTSHAVVPFLICQEYSLSQNIARGTSLNWQTMSAYVCESRRNLRTRASTRKYADVCCELNLIRRLGAVQLSVSLHCVIYLLMCIAFHLFFCIILVLARDQKMEKAFTLQLLFINVS